VTSLPSGPPAHRKKSGQDEVKKEDNFFHPFVVTDKDRISFCGVGFAGTEE
jgi:hypothetical protein